MATMDEMKDERSALKRKVTVLATRLKKAVLKGLSSSTISNLFSELEQGYLDFLEKDDEYIQKIEEDESLREDYATVNLLSLEDYTASVDTAYQDAKGVYHQHKKKKKGKKRVPSESDTGESSSTDGEKDDKEESTEGDKDGDKGEDIVNKVDNLSEGLLSYAEGKSETKSNLGDADAEELKAALDRLLGGEGGQASTTAGETHTPSPASHLLSTYSFPGSGYQFPTNPSYSSSYQIPLPAVSNMPNTTTYQPYQQVPHPSYFPPGIFPPTSSAPYIFPGQLPPNAATIPSSAGPFIPPIQPRHNVQVKVKAAELPHFSGFRKHWPEFKSIWPKLAIPAFPSKELLAVELRRCIKGTVAERKTEHISIVGPQSFDEIWNCLSEFYDDDAAAVNSILKELTSLKSVKEGDYRGLVEHINKTEGCFTQLSTLDQQGSLNMREVDNQALLLPESVKKEWHKIYQNLKPLEKRHPFPAYINFLKGERTSIARLAEQQPPPAQIATRRKEGTSNNANLNSTKRRPKCAVHQMEAVKHNTEHCQVFQQMDREEKLRKLREVNACYRCLGYHQRGKCPCKEVCGQCGRVGHKSILCLTRSSDNQQKSEDSPTPKKSGDAHHSSQSNCRGLYAIFSVPVVGSNKFCSVFAEDGSDSTYIKDEAARRLGARVTNKYLLEVTTTGGNETEYESTEYELDLRTRTGRILTIRCFGLKNITGPLSDLDPAIIKKLFPDHDSSLLLRKSKEVDVLLGTDYFGAHPKREVCSAGDNLSIMEGELGVCLQGSHPLLQGENSLDCNMVKVLKSAHLQVDTNHSRISHVKHAIFEKPLDSTHSKATQSHITNAEFTKINDFIRGEEMGTQITPNCGSCKCSKCPLPGHTFSFQEESELKLIRDNLQYNEEEMCWSTKYPWKCDPRSLPNNKSAALATLHRQEKRLNKDKELKITYHEQVKDMISRGVARELSPQELLSYSGPLFYITHLGVPNPKSKSTPYRIVFNSSQRFSGFSLNDSLCKGPDAYMNSQLGLLLRWREESEAVIGDIKKMYNSVHLKIEEQHCHRFLWRYDESSPPKTYCITRVNMGDKPAGAISTEAMYMTADKFSSDHPQAAVMLKVGTYVDDIMNSVASKEEAQDLAQGAEKILEKGGFKIKFWLFTGSHVEEDHGIVHVLGVCWKPEEDTIGFQASLNFSQKKQGVHIQPDLKPEEISANIPEKLTKRIVLAQMMRIYDPTGLLSPFTLKGKILLRRSWQLKLGWDDVLPPVLQALWTKFFNEVSDISKIWYPRVLKPESSEGQPNLVIFSDASDEALGFVAYARWKCSDETYRSRLIFAKSRVAPLTKRTTPQLELNAAVMSKRAREVIMKEMRYDFNTDQTLHITDSETVLGMLQKTSTRFKLYEGVRVGEIQAATNGDVSSWAWICGENNISDWVTRGKDLRELGPTSEWFLGPSFMSKPVEEWGLKDGILHSQQSLPGEKKEVSSNAAQLEITPPQIINYQRFSKYRILVRALARVLNVFRKKSLFAMKESPTVSVIEKAEEVIVRDLQKELEDECKKKDRQGRVGGIYYRLKPVLADGIWVVGTRLKENPLVPENKPQYLLPTRHHATNLLMIQAHKEVVHRSRDTTLARFRQKYWIVQGSKIANSVISNCLLCKLRKPKLISQKMGSLPKERTCPAPAFTNCMVDYFGPYSVRGEVQKRTSGKAWGVIFCDLASRAVFIEAVHEYTTDAFLIALSKFASVRGYPRVMYSDPGSNLCSASKELNNQWKMMWKEEKEKIISHSSENGMEWRFSTADSPWQNGAVEALVKSAKKILNIVMQNQRLSPSEFGGVLYSVANSLNERPIGSMTVDSELSILTPNSLLLGRSTAKNPGGWHPTTSTFRRFNLVQQVHESFWAQWIKTTAPGLITDSKWHHEGRELQPGDVVLVIDSDTIKSEYRIAVVQEVIRSSDGAVRKARVLYKNYRVGDRVVQYRPSAGQSVLRPVQRLALVVPVNTTDT